MSAPSTPGWHDDPDGRRRWWDGKRWGAFAPWDDQDSPGTPTPTQPQRPRLDPSLTFDPTAAGRAARAMPAAERGALPHRAERPLRTPRPADARQPRGGTSMAVAYALAVALGLLGAHRFYLGRVSSATAQMLLSFAAAGAVVVLVGDPSALVLAALPLAAVGWWLVDLFRTAGMVRERNRRQTERSDAPGYDRGWPPA